MARSGCSGLALRYGSGHAVTLEASSSEVARRTVLRLTPSYVMEVADRLDLRPGAGVTAVVAVPLKHLQQNRDVTGFALGAPVAALTSILELIASEPLHRVIEQLGDHADNPTYEELAAALEDLSGELGVDDVVAVLGFAVAANFPAAGPCRQLLDERDEWRLPELPPRGGSTTGPRRETEAERSAVREQRRLRRAAQKKKPVSGAPPRSAHRKRAPITPSDRSTSSSGGPAVDSPSTPRRRRYQLTPRELDRFDDEHPLVGSVLVVEVPFSAVDPEIPEQKAKARPALVVAATPGELLVRPIYSHRSPTRSLFTAWRRLGLAHPSYIDVERIEVSAADVAPGPAVGIVSDAEWNELI